MILLMVSRECLWVSQAAADSEVFNQDKVNGIISQAPGLHSIRIVPDPLDHKKRVVRFEVREGDIWRGDAQRGMFGVERSELSEPEYRAPFRADLWYQFRVLVPDESTDMLTRCLIAQWHATPDTHLGEVLRSPVLGIEIRGNK